MKWIGLSLIFLSSLSFAQKTVLVGYYDAFKRASFNNSKNVALGLAEKFKNNSDVIIKLCPLKTSFDKAYDEFHDCLMSLSEEPILTLSLGEANCDFKMETLVKNVDQSSLPDNEGVIHREDEIVPAAPRALGLRYPLPQMYCSLSKKERRKVVISNNPGSFVCNNTAFRMSYKFPEIQFGLVHVPSHRCRKLKKRTIQSIEYLKTMITGAILFLDTQFFTPLSLPHSSNELRLPLHKRELKKLREEYSYDECLKKYFKLSGGVDEKKFPGLF